MKLIYINCSLTLILIFKNLSIVSIAKAWSCLGSPSIITSYGLSSYQSYFFVTSLSVISTNRAEVAVYRLLQHYQTPRKGNDRRTIFKIVYSTLKLIANKVKVKVNTQLMALMVTITSAKLYCNPVTQYTLFCSEGLCNKSLLKMAGDVELNPGPGGRVLILLNCRGLKRESKFRQLINRLYKSHSGPGTLIVALQEIQ